MKTVVDEILSLANLWCEAQLNDAQRTRLQELLREDRRHRALFLELIQLHGQLSWDAGHFAGTVTDPTDVNTITCDLAAVVADLPAVRQSMKAEKRRNWQAMVAGIAAAAMLALGITQLTTEDAVTPVVQNPSVQQQANSDANQQDPLMADIGEQPLKPLILDGVNQTAPQAQLPGTELPNSVTVPENSAASFSDADVIASIDQWIETAWNENQASPADDASDGEWLRRLYLTVAGRIPSTQETSAFLSDPSGRRKPAAIDRLLSDPATAENLAGTWTNLLIGRSNPRGVDQQALYRFLREEFTQNRPWIETVGDLIAAEGRSDQNGATNFLLAHLNDQATPATAVTARLFLGQQVHCTQCHDHPFAKDRSQEQFWTLNAFFKQAQRTVQEPVLSNGSRQNIWLLEDAGQPGMTFYDSKQGLKKAVLPEFAGTTVPVSETGSRRAALARLLRTDDQHHVARAMVNRMWAQFFGYGFTNPVDDLGPHNPVSHPELFDALTSAFVQSNYDLQRLTRWIASSRAFGLSSLQSSEGLAADDPQEGGTPLFSRSYIRPMAPEQVYDSIRIAIRSVADQPLDSSAGADHRRQWVEQFVRSYGTDENDERLEFEGNIAQAMLMMNGLDIAEAIPLAADEITQKLPDGAASVANTLQKLAMATLNREPTDKEERVFRNRFRSLTRSMPQQDAIRTATEDMLWAYLNSSEFTSVH
ncbi:MAG: DUF1549 domain-containing protein [Planctomycetota bacterium]